MKPWAVYLLIFLFGGTFWFGVYLIASRAARYLSETVLP
jgi:hypothetical protein